MRDVYEVLRQKELEVSRLEKEVEALRVAAPLLADGEAGSSTGPQPIDSLQSRAVNDTPQDARAAVGGDRAKKHWP